MLILPDTLPRATHAALSLFRYAMRAVIRLFYLGVFAFLFVL